MNRFICILVANIALLLPSITMAQSVANEADVCPLELPVDQLTIEVYEGFTWVDVKSAETQGLNKIFNPNLNSTEDFSLTSPDGEVIEVGVGRNATSKEGEVLWYFSQLENDSARQFSVQTPNGDNYLVGSDETLRVTLSPPISNAESTQTAEIIGTVDCPGLIKLVYGASTKAGGWLLGTAIAGGIAVIANNNNDDQSPEVSEPTAPSPPARIPPPSSPATATNSVNN